MKIVAVVIFLSFAANAFAQDTAALRDSVPPWKPSTSVGVEYAWSDNFPMGAEGGDNIGWNAGYGRSAGLRVERTITPLYSAVVSAGERSEALARVRSSYLQLQAQLQGGFRWGLFFAVGFNLSVITSSAAAQSSDTLAAFRRNASLYLVPSLGWSLPIGPVSVFTDVQWDIPLTTISDHHGQSWRVTSVSYAVGAKYRI